MLTAWSIGNLFHGVYRKVDYVEITGNSAVSTDEITSVLYSLDDKDKFILKSKSEIVEELRKIEIISEVMLKYSLPSKLLITVKERTPVLFYHTEYLVPRIVDSNFEEFYDERVNLQNLVYIRGQYSREKIQSFIQLLQKFPYVYNNLTEIENFFDYRFNIVLNNKLYIMLPENNVEVSLQRLQEYIVKYNLLRTNIYKVDMRNEDKVFFASNAEITQYVPEQNRYVMYKVRTRSEKYRQIIENAISKI